MFVPNDKATLSREGARESRELLEKSRPMFRAHARTFRWFGISNLFVAAAAVLVAMGLFWQRKRRGAVHAAVELPMADQ